MQRALKVPEIVHIIMQNFHLDPPYIWFLKTSEFNKKTLFSASLTCHAFSGPALDVLWYSMTSLEPLFKLLSNFQSSDPNQSASGSLWGSISQTDLRTVEKYAPRIRRFYYGSADDSVDVFACIHLLQAGGFARLLPNLVYLDAKLDDVEVADSGPICKILYLISPLLRGVTITGPTSIRQVVPLLNSLQTHAPNISILDFRTATFNSQCMSAIWSLPQLQKLLIDVWDYSATSPVLNVDHLTRISSNQTLRQLTILGAVKLVSSHTKFGQRTVAFSALESIHFGCPNTSISLINGLLSRVSLPRLRSLYVDIDAESKDKANERHYWNQFFDLIGKATTNCFKILHFSDDECNALDSFWKDAEITVSKFPNLDKLSLEEFTISTPILHRLHKIDVQKIVSAWPALRRLHLTAICQPYKLQFDALLDIAQGLPFLIYLAIPVDLLLLPNEIPLLAHPLLVLNLQISSMQPHLKYDVVQAINQIFPELETLRVFCAGYPEFSSEAMHLLSMLRAAKRHEAQRVALGMRGASAKGTDGCITIDTLAPEKNMES